MKYEGAWREVGERKAGTSEIQSGVFLPPGGGGGEVVTLGEKCVEKKHSGQGQKPDIAKQTKLWPLV